MLVRERQYCTAQLGGIVANKGAVRQKICRHDIDIAGSEGGAIHRHGTRAGTGVRSEALR